MQFPMVTDVSSSGKYCSIVSILDGSKQWHNYVTFMESLNFSSSRLKRICLVR